MVRIKKQFDRLSLFVEKYRVRPDGCWEWIAAKTANGYGIFWSGQRTMVAHRWAYEHFVGPIPIGLQLDHLCRNRACVNAMHLEPVTHAENGRRGIAGQHRIEEARLITHCKNGHHFDFANTGWGKNKSGRPYRMCRRCRREQRKQYCLRNPEIVKRQRKDSYAKLGK